MGNLYQSIRILVGIVPSYDTIGVPFFVSSLRIGRIADSISVPVATRALNTLDSEDKTKDMKTICLMEEALDLPAHGIGHDDGRK